jgi:hypothetical protein
VVADVGDVDEGVLGELLLDAEEVALDVAVAGVLGDPGDVVGGRVEGGDEAGGDPWLGGGVAAGGGLPTAMICAGSGEEQWLVVVGLIWVTAANCAWGR